MPETPRLTDEIRADLDRRNREIYECVMKGLGELERAESKEEKLAILASLEQEIGDVRGKVSVRARVGIGRKLALVGGLLAAFGGGAVAGAVFSGDKQPTPTADSVPKAGVAECPPCVEAGDSPNPKKSGADSEPAHPEGLIPDYMAGLRDREAANRASAATSEAIKEGIERLKRDYLDALRKSKDESLSAQERAYATEDATSFAESLRKNGIKPESLDGQVSSHRDPGREITPAKSPTTDATDTPPRKGSMQGRELLPEK